MIQVYISWLVVGEMTMNIYLLNSVNLISFHVVFLNKMIQN